MATKKTKKSVNARLDVELYEQMRAVAAGRQLSMTGLIEAALQDHLSKDDPPVVPAAVSESAGVPSFKDASAALECECDAYRPGRFRGHENDVLIHVEIKGVVHCTTQLPAGRRDCNPTQAQLDYWQARRVKRGV